MATHSSRFIFAAALLTVFLMVPKLLHAEPMVGLSTSNSLVLFDTDISETALKAVSLSGLQSGETIVGIDFRPADGLLYGVGSTSRLYTIDIDTGAATQVGTGQFSTLLSGTNFGVDFNPVADRLRVVSDSGQNLRIDPTTGALTAEDTALAFDPADTNFGATPAVVAAAYTNNFVGASTTSLLSVDSTLDALLLQGGVAGSPSPNTGLLTTLGSVGVDTTADVGFDVSSLSGVAYLSMTRSGTTASELYSIQFSTGLPVHRVGAISSAVFMRDISSPVLESTAPTLAITAPTRVNSRTRRNLVTFTGTANDNVYVTSVQYRTRFNGGRFRSFQTATGTDSWTFTIPTNRVGRTTVQVKAIDVFGNESAVTTYRVTRSR